MIIHATGDAFKAGADIIVQGCNCFCVMGAGFALQMSKYYPAAVIADNATKKGDAGKLGTISVAHCDDIFTPGHQVFIVNAYTQYHPRRDPPPFDYDACAKAMDCIKRSFHPECSIAMPRVGCGLAGGDWSLVEPIIANAFDDRTVTVYTYTP